MIELSATERRRHKRLADEAAERRAGSGARRESEAAAIGASSEEMAVRTRAADLPTINMPDARTTLERAAEATLIVIGKATYLDFPRSDYAGGRERIDVTRIVGLGPIGREMLSTIVARMKGRAPGSMGVYVGTLSPLVPVFAAVLGENGTADELPPDFFEHVEQFFRTRLKVDALDNNQNKRLDKMRIVVGSLPGAGHVDCDRKGRFDNQLKSEPLTLKEHELVALLRLCMKVVEEVVAGERQLGRFIVDGVVIDGPWEGSALSKAAVLRRFYPGGPPKPQILRAEHPECANVRLEELRHLIAIAYPTPSRLVAFLTVLAVFTRFNPSVIGGMKRSDVNWARNMGAPFVALEVEAEAAGHPTEDGEDEVPDVHGSNGDAGAVLGELELQPFKPRAFRRQYASFPVTGEADNPGVLTRFVLDWTAGLSEAGGIEANNVFLFVGGTSGRSIGSFGGKDGGNFRDSLKRLILDEQKVIGDEGGDAGRRRVRVVAPKELRAAAVDLVWLATGGDRMMMRAAGWWRDWETPENFYHGPKERARGDEQLSWSKLLERRRLVNGIDAGARPEEFDKGAATPGWICYNPLNGPLSSAPGELCSAIGHCPICPHSDVDETSPNVAAHVVALADALLAKLDAMPGDAWAVRWEPQYDSLLTDWIPLFGDTVREAAKKLPRVVIEDF